MPQFSFHPSVEFSSSLTTQGFYLTINEKGEDLVTLYFTPKQFEQLLEVLP